VPGEPIMVLLVLVVVLVLVLGLECGIWDVICVRRAEMEDDLTTN
jgi:hypothetical protein